MTDPVAFNGDFLHQLIHVGDCAHRLLAMQDQDPLSPSFGSFHYGHWRDKTSEFADARFQEAGAALGLLAHPQFQALGKARGWPQRDVLLEAFRRGLSNLKRLQYPGGCYDEWYKGERGFAATAFTTFAYASAALELAEQLPETARVLLAETLAAPARWLQTHDDLVKTNHQVVAAAALAAHGSYTGDETSLEGARAKLRSSLETQRPEGWFPELRGMDFGYSALIVDYLGHYGRWMGMDTVADAAQRLIRFMVPHFHPDLTLSAEAGTCRNPYAGQAGYALLAPLVPEADAVAQRLVSLSPEASQARLSAYLTDDLRLARWAILPLLGALASRGLATSAAAPATPQGWTVHPDAGVAAYHDGGLHIHFPFVGGAVTRVYSGDRLLVADFGVEGRDDQGRFTSQTYRQERALLQSDGALVARIELTQPRYFFPGFLQRLVLRMGSITVWSSLWLRAGIDWYRLRKHTAINQSSTSVARSAGRYAIDRRIEVRDGVVHIVDDVDAVGLALELRLKAGEGVALIGSEVPLPNRGSVRKSIDPETRTIGVVRT